MSQYLGLQITNGKTKNTRTNGTGIIRISALLISYDGNFFVLGALPKHWKFFTLSNDLLAIRIFCPTFC
jgi:hypothetical protein